MRQVGRDVHRCSLMRMPDQGSIFNARILRKPAPRTKEPTSGEADRGQRSEFNRHLS